MGRRKNSTKVYESLSPEELSMHVRKNISIPRYMDSFLFENNISLSKLVQNAITARMRQEQKKSLKKEVIQEHEERSIRKKINVRRKENPNFDNELQRAKFLLGEYFSAFDENDKYESDIKKQVMLSDYPELYVDIIKFEKWFNNNQELYSDMKEKISNPVERLIRIKKLFI